MATIERLRQIVYFFPSSFVVQVATRFLRLFRQYDMYIFCFLGLLWLRIQESDMGQHHLRHIHLHWLLGYPQVPVHPTLAVTIRICIMFFRILK